MNPDGDTDELRVRMRAALRRTIESITCLFVAVGRSRRAAVRVQFKSGTHRDYIIVTSNGSASWSCVSAVWPASTGKGEIDLRKPTDAKKVETVLLALDPSSSAEESH